MKGSLNFLQKKNRIALRISFIYFLIGVLWILFSDLFLRVFTNRLELIAEIQILKGWFYVGVTAVLLFYLVLQSINKYQETENELIRAKDEAQKADKLKTEFLAQMSHEIRSPINTILNYISLVKEDVQNNMDPELQYSFTAIDNSSRRLIRTVDLILDMSQMQTGYFEVYPREIDILKEIILPVINELKPRASEKGLKLSCENKSYKNLVKLDAYTVTEIFDNLIDNAIKYTLNGEIKIILYDNEQKDLCVDVCDTGIGISNDFMDKIFTPFVQEESGYTRGFDGNGLGLALVKRYCELNNAGIMVRSKKGEGSVFTVIFRKSGPEDTQKLNSSALKKAFY